MGRNAISMVKDCGRADMRFSTVGFELDQVKEYIKNQSSRDKDDDDNDDGEGNF